MRRLLALPILLALAAVGAPLQAAPPALADLPLDEAAAPVSEPRLERAADTLGPRADEHARVAKRWDLVDDTAAITLGVAAFRLQSGASFQHDALYGEIRPSCALTSCEGEGRSYVPTWDGLKLASTSLAFAAVGVGATWLVAAPSERRFGVSSIEIKLSTGGTTGLTLIGRF